MPPCKRRCCVPYCNNIQEISKKQFFKIGANLEGREKWPTLVGKTISAKSQVLFCCEDHFDLPNDAENYIRFKYIPKTKLKLRPNVLPQKKLPANVCRLCLKLIYNGNDFVDISEKKGGNNAKIIAATLPKLDLSITLEPVACLKCFEPLEKYYEIKQNALNSEMIVVNCIKLIVKRSPSRLVQNCQIDLFEEYNNIVDLLEKEKERTKGSQRSTVTHDSLDILEEKLQETDTSPEKIIIQIEEPNDDIYTPEANKNNFESCQNNVSTVLTSKNTNVPLEGTNFSVVQSVPPDKIPEERSTFELDCLEVLPVTTAAHDVNIPYELADTPMELSSEDMYIHIENEPSEDVEIVTAHL